jgi:cysteine desulfurase
MRERTYLDHNASTPLDPAVREAMARADGMTWGNPSSPHLEGRMARELLENARERVAAVLACRPREVLFTSGGTESVNLALLGAARARAPRGRRLVVTAVEHACVLDAAEGLAAEGYEVARVPPSADGTVEAAAVASACTPGTTVVAVMLANHETGALLPVRAVADAVRARGVALVCDAVLGPGLLDIRADVLGVDLMALSGHKCNGPKGIGALYVRRRTKVDPVVRGGPQEERVRGGTENVVGAVGLAVALERAEAGRAERAAHCRALSERLLEGVLAGIPDARLVGPREGRLPSTVLLELPGCEGEALLINLDLEGIAASTGSACAVGGTAASPVLLAMGLPPRRAASTIRFSVGPSTTVEDVDRALAALSAIVGRLRALAR